jgi:hypothetical protein
MYVNITHCEESIVLLTIWAIPTIAVSIWNIGIGVTKPTVNTYWKFVPVEKYNKLLNCTSISAHKHKFVIYTFLSSYWSRFKTTGSITNLVAPTYLLFMQDV